MNKIKKLILIIAIIITTSISFAEEIDENAMFSDTETTTAETEKVVNNVSILEEEKKSVSLSGELTAHSSYSVTRDNLEGNGKAEDNTYQNYMSANLLLDIRLKNSIKGFGNVQIDYYPQGLKENQTFNILGADIDVENSTSAKYALKELFVDMNVNKKAYFRVGKQVLQWGRGYLWNPTDMINIDKKKFESEAGYREGAYGIKMHIPFGTTLNIYSFLDMTNVENIEDIAAAGKVEFLVGSTEMAVSGWAKKDMKSVLGFDLSSRIGKFDVWGETSLSYGDNSEKIKVENNEYIIYKEKDKLIPRISIGTSRSFDVKDEKDRINVTGEFYYNGGGYDDNVFANKKKRNVTFEIDGLRADQNGDITNTTITTTAAVTLSEYMFSKKLNNPNNISKYYAALFSSYKKFIIDDMTLNLNIIANLVDETVMINPSVAYTNMSDLTINLGITGIAGPKNGEYTAWGRGLDVTMSAGISF